jgi:ATP-binding cassette subfamily B protein
MNAFLQERITGMRVIQIFNAEKQEMDKFKQINRDYTQANVDSVLYYAIFFPVVEFISSLTLALIVWIGTKGIWSGTISIGAFIAFPMFINMLFRPIRMLADKFNTLQMGLVAAGRIFNVLDNNNRIEDNGTQNPESLRGVVEFKNVSFAYDDKNFVINDLSFKIEQGTTLAIVGSTGSGKSTIINLLNRFYEIQKGEILIDNINIEDFYLESLRSRIAIVLQDVFLFNGTVFDNIRLRDQSISDEQILEASKMIGADAFLSVLPDGYNFQITERGSNLSMGQRQLISFVRALVFNPDILILDEATSSIDTETEAIIQYAIEKLIEKRSSVIIAHRLSTIMHANQIMVLEKGRLVELGHHNELIENENGKYKKLYEMQLAAQLT